MNPLIRSINIFRCVFLPCMMIFIGVGQGDAQNARQWQRLRNLMVEEEIVEAGVTNQRVIGAMRSTPRHEFVRPVDRKRAYLDMALPIGSQQTISPPFVVAYMTEQLDPKSTDRVLEIGTGSGYQAAVLSPLVRDVYSIEIVESLSRKATRTLKRLKYKNVFTRAGDGYLGWPEAAPFDKIIVTCSPEKVPQTLIDQLRDGGMMVVPVGERYQQNLYLFRKENGQLVQEALRATLFVPMTGKAEGKRMVQPNPLRPAIVNGGFEETQKEKNLPEAWHYLRQIEIIADESDAPRGKNFARFTNDTPGRGCRALQGFAIDGRKIARVTLSYRVRGKEIRYGQNHQQWPFVGITFYDKRRAIVSHEKLGPYNGTFAWIEEKKGISVPIRAREAIIRIGLLGAIGQIDLDDIELIPAK